MKLGKLYRSTHLTTRILILVSVMLMASALAWVNEMNVFLTAGAVIAVGAVLETFMVHSRKTFIVVIWIVNLLISGGFVFTIYWIFMNFTDANTAIINAGLVGITSIINFAVAGYLCSKLARGRRWWHLIVSFALYYVAFILIIGNFPQAGIILPISVAFAASALYPVIVYVVKRVANRNKTVIHELPVNKNQTLLVKEVKELTGSLKEVSFDEATPGVKTYHNENTVLVVLPLAGKEERNAVFSDNKLLIDGEDYAWALEEAVINARVLSRKTKVRQSRIIPIVVVNNINLPKSITPIKIRERKNPDEMLGTVLVVKKNQIPQVIKQATNKLSAKEIAKLEAL